MLELKDVSISYLRDEYIIKDLSFQIDAGSTVGIIGANGAGKTTLLKGILGLINIVGEIAIDNENLTKQNISKLRKMIGYVSQNSDEQLFMPTVYEDMIFGPLNYGLTKEEAERAVEKTLEKLDIKDIAMEHNYKLSGGQMKMAAIAVALVLEPKILLMDEPSSGLDPKNRRKLINTLKDIDVTKIIATHDLDLVLDTCDRVIIMNHGKIVADGEPVDILANKDLLEKNNLELPLCMTKPDFLSP